MTMTTTTPARRLQPEDRNLAILDAAYSLAERALRMMQESHDNRYFTWRCVSDAERAAWYAKAKEELKG